jgi:hypothetical protein
MKSAWNYRAETVTSTSCEDKFPPNLGDSLSFLSRSYHLVLFVLLVMFMECSAGNFLTHKRVYRHLNHNFPKRCNDAEGQRFRTQLFH